MTIKFPRGMSPGYVPGPGDLAWSNPADEPPYWYECETCCGKGEVWRDEPECGPFTEVCPECNGEKGEWRDE